MADELDFVAEAIEKNIDLKVESIRAQAQRIPAGHPGECHYCGEHSLRLVNGACAPCRDKLELG